MLMKRQKQKLQEQKEIIEKIKKLQKELFLFINIIPIFENYLFFAVYALYESKPPINSPLM